MGIVKAVTAALEQNSANLEHSKMAILGGEFAMILHLTLPTLTAAEQIQKALEKDLPSFCISQRTTTPPRKAVDEGALWELSFEGPDQPGIVSAVTQALATHGANVHMLETETCSAPFAGYEMFHMASRFAVCGGKVEGIEAALKKVEDRFGASIVLREAEE